MTKEVMVERQEALAHAPEVAYLRSTIETLRKGNEAILKENARLKEQLAPFYQRGEGVPSDADLLDLLGQAEDTLACAREWYDEEYPAEEGHDQVYPWDHT